MRRFCKRVMCVAVGAVLSVCLVGCSTKQSAIFDMESGGTIEVSYDKDGGYNLFYEESVFYIGNRNEIPKVNGYFADEGTFEYYSVAVDEDESASLLGVSDAFNNEFLTYSIGVEDAIEYVHMFRVSDTDVYVALVSFEGEEFLLSQKDHLTFAVE